MYIYEWYLTALFCTFNATEISAYIVTEVRFKKLSIKGKFLLHCRKQILKHQ